MAGLGSEHMGSGVEGGQWGSKTGCPSVGEQERGGGCSCVPATGQRRGQKGGVCPFVEDCAIGSWAETPGAEAAPLLILGLAGQQREEGGEGESQSAQTSRQTLLSHCGGRWSPGLGVSWLGLRSRPWINQTCNLGQAPSQLCVETWWSLDPLPTPPQHGLVSQLPRDFVPASVPVAARYLTSLCLCFFLSVKGE